MYNQINISSGHSINCQGAVDIINEVAEAKRVVDRVYEICKSLGIEVYKYHDTYTLQFLKTYIFYKLYLQLF